MPGLLDPREHDMSSRDAAEYNRRKLRGLLDTINQGAESLASTMPQMAAPMYLGEDGYQGGMSPEQQLGGMMNWVGSNMLGGAALSGVTPGMVRAGGLVRNAPDMDLSHLPVGAPEFRNASDDALAAALESIRARNKAKGLEDDMATGAIRDEIARRNAVVDLGLPESNTAGDRARAMGFNVDAYHGTNADFPAFDASMADSRRKTGTPSGAIVASTNPLTSNSYAGETTSGFTGEVTGYDGGGNVIPLALNLGKGLSISGKKENWNNLYSSKYPDIMTTNDFAELAKQKGKDSATIKNVRDNANWMPGEQNKARIGDTVFLFDPKNIRSRFASFDPRRRNEANLLASMAGAGLLTPALANYLSPQSGLLGD